MNRYVISIVLAGVFWGLTGFFSRYMTGVGMGSDGTILLRCGIGALFFLAYICWKNPRQLRIAWRDLWCFLGAGFCSLLFFSFCYFQAMTFMSLSAAAILLYTAPGFVMVFCLIIFGEKLTKKKIFALLLAFLGCALTSGLGAGGLVFSPVGLLYGLGAGLGYGLYSIFARLALNRGYSSNTINFYACFLAAAGAAVIWDGSATLEICFGAWEVAAMALAMGFVSCFCPYALYTYGLTKVEAGKASIMASIEVVVATLVGIFAFGEGLTILGALGMGVVLGAIFVLNYSKKKLKNPG